MEPTLPWIAIGAFLIISFFYLYEIHKVKNNIVDSIDDRFEVAFKYAPHGMAIVSTEGRFLKVNKELKNILQYTESKLLNSKFIDITYIEDINKGKEALKELISGKVKFVEFEKRYIRGMDQKVIWINLKSSPVFGDDGKVKFLISQIQDITHVVELEKDVQDQLKSLKQSNEELEQFAYIASHDLREPLRSISGFLMLLENELQGERKENEKIDKYFKLILKGSERMGGFIDDLLEYSRLTSNKGFAYDVYSFEQAMMEIRSNLDSILKEKDIQIIYDVITGKQKIRFPAARFIQVIQNLILNSIKYCENDKIEIYIYVRETDGRLYIRLIDNGIGIPKDKWEKVFKPFVRLSSMGKKKGSGIGLAVCHKIISQYGGNIWVKESSPSGTTIEMYIPSCEAKEELGSKL